MTGPARYAVGLDVGSAQHAMSRLPARGRPNAVSRPCRRSVGWLVEGPHLRPGRRDGIHPRCRHGSRAARRTFRSKAPWSASAALPSRGSIAAGLYEFGRPREIDPGDLNYAVELASKVRLHGRPHRAAGCAAGLHARWPGRISQSARCRLRAPRSERSRDLDFGARASGAGECRSSCAPGRRRDDLRAGGRRHTLPCSLMSAAAASPSWTSARIRRIWSCTTATRCFAPAASRSRRTTSRATWPSD